MTQIMSTNLAAEAECFKLTENWSNMFRPLDDPDYPWLGLWITLPIMGVWYWCTDQVWAFESHCGYTPPKAFLLLYYSAGFYLPVSGNMYQDQTRSKGPSYSAPVAREEKALGTKLVSGYVN